MLYVFKKWSGKHRIEWYFILKKLKRKGVTFRAGVKLESGCWLWCIHWFWSQLRDADGQITFLKRTETRRDQNAIFTHRGRKIFANNCTQGYCKLLTTLTVCSYIQQSFKVTSRSLQLPEVLTTAAAVYVTVVTSLLLRHRGYIRWTHDITDMAVNRLLAASILL